MGHVCYMCMVLTSVFTRFTTQHRHNGFFGSVCPPPPSNCVGEPRGKSVNGCMSSYLLKESVEFIVLISSHVMCMWGVVSEVSCIFHS